MPPCFLKSEHSPDTANLWTGPWETEDSTTGVCLLELASVQGGSNHWSFRSLNVPGADSPVWLPSLPAWLSFWLITMFVFPEQVGAGPAIHYPASAAAEGGRQWLSACMQGRKFWFLPELVRKRWGVCLEKSVQTQRQQIGIGRSKVMPQISK